MITRLNLSVSPETHPMVYQLASSFLGYHSNYNEQYSITTVGGRRVDTQVFRELGIAEGLDPQTDEGTVVIFNSMIAGSRTGIVLNSPLDQEGWPNPNAASILIPLRNCDQLKIDTHSLKPQGTVGSIRFRQRTQNLPLVPVTLASSVLPIASEYLTSSLCYDRTTTWSQWTNLGNQTAQFLEILRGSCQSLITSSQ